jgi:hypothetical protein
MRLGYSFMVRIERLIVSRGMVKNFTIFFWHSSVKSDSFYLSHSLQQLLRIAFTFSEF